MKRVLFNYYGMQSCCNSKFHGASEYGLTVLSYLIVNYHTIAHISIIYNPQTPIEEWLNEILIEYNIEKHEIECFKDIKKICNMYDIDIFYSPTRLPSSIRSMVGKDVVIKVTMHDFRGIELIEDVQMIKFMSLNSAIKNILKKIFFKQYRTYLINKTTKEIELADEIFCVSKHTFYSMQLIFNNRYFTNKKINIYFSPAKKTSIYKGKNLDRFNKRYILLIGGDRWTKNPYRTMLALDIVFSNQQYEDYSAIVIGDVSEKIKKTMKNKEKFQYFTYVAASKLEEYYAKCDIFVYASLNEGFGYPPIEAMKYGKTCVVSGTTSMPEVCGDAVYYVNPYSIYEIAEKICMALKERINEEIIISHYNKIATKQQQDLCKLCKEIII